MADGFALKGYNFALDVIVFIGQERLNQHRNLNEIHSNLLERGVQISSRRISDFFTVYELLLSTTHVDKLRVRREEIIEAGGVRLAIDGIQPQAGKEVLYIFRDAMSGERLAAVSLAHHDQKTLAREMEKVAQLLNSLELPLRSIITDHQPGLIQAVAEVWEDVPHQFCQLHFLKALAKPIGRQDSNLAKTLKKQLRPIKEIERQLAEEQELLRQSKNQADEAQILPPLMAPEITVSQEQPVNSPAAAATAAATAAAAAAATVAAAAATAAATLPFSSLPQLTNLSHKSPPNSPSSLCPRVGKATASEILITSPSSPTSSLNTQIDLTPATHGGASLQAPVLASVSDSYLTPLPVVEAASQFVQLAEPAHEEYFLADVLLPKMPWQEEEVPISSTEQLSELGSDLDSTVVRNEECDNGLMQNCEQNSPPQEQGDCAHSLSPAQQLELIQVHFGYTDAIRRLLLLKPLAPFKLVGLDIYEQAIQLSSSIARCLHYHPDPTLNSIQDLLIPISLFEEQYLTINRRQQYLLAFADLLEVSKTPLGDWCETGAEVATQFEEFLSHLPAYAELYPEDSNLLAYFRARSLEWMEGLFYCYDERDSPRTNNSLEQYNNFLKSQRRRVTGQKHVADYLIRHGPLIIGSDPDESFEQILSRFRQVSFETFKEEYGRFREASRRPRNTLSYCRDPEKYITNLEQQYIEIFA